MRAAVLGSPIAHSLSPALHRAAYAHLGLSWTYDAIECDEAGLPALVAGLGPDWAGLSLTMPLKAAVLPLLDHRDADVELTGAANTMVLRDGRRLGSNTDVPGMVAVLERLATSRAVRAGGISQGVVVLGAGATARSAVAALAAAGQRSATLVARRPAAAGAVREVAGRSGLALDVVGWGEAATWLLSPLVVSTVPAGATDDLAPGIADLGGPRGTLLDVVYRPWPTPLAVAWTRAGGLAVGGFDLLVEQAVLQVRLMTGVVAGEAAAGTGLAEVMRRAGLDALSRH
jgi:shikimate dehydrogenase